ncbi:hypothetical protein D3C80_759130 [compost metagenome]
MPGYVAAQPAEGELGQRLRPGLVAQVQRVIGLQPGQGDFVGALRQADTLCHEGLQGQPVHGRHGAHVLASQ